MKKRLLALLCALLLLTQCVSAIAAEGSTPVSMRQEDGTIRKNVQVRFLGSVLTTIWDGGQNLIIPSSRLIWDRTAPLDQHFAYLYYKNKTVNLRLTEKPKSAILAKATVGKIVMVAEVGEKYSKIVYGDTVGWVATSVLRFLGPLEETPVSAQISYKDSVTSTHKVNLRQGPSKGSKVLTGLQPGMTAVVRSQKDDWAEIEVNGWHGWIQTQFLTVTGPVSLEPEVAEPDARSTEPEATPEPETPEATPEPVAEPEPVEEPEAEPEPEEVDHEPVDEIDEPDEPEEETPETVVDLYQPLPDDLFEPI
ncbi:MAG: SH3 domain-containing protein [Clostridia bacterium]|nr:SH3 domain-containing protein [Clostridia bacterium]